MKKLLIVLSICCLTGKSRAQADSCGLQVSLITCGPGQDLYSIWGHTGVRVTDTTRHIDVVFNYGTFDDSDPLFYLRFTRGLMMYAVAPFSYADFMEEYRVEKRSVTEQVLDLSCPEKTALAKALWINTDPQNKFYPYHFYADNCTTRARDMIINHTGPGLTFREVRPLPGETTYRQLIHSYMKSSIQGWNRFAIDVLLGNHLDEKMNNLQAMFLPDYLMVGFGKAALHSHPLVKETLLLLPDGQPRNSTFFTPVNFFSLLAGLMLLLSFLPYPQAARTLTVLDNLFFLFTGLLGTLMLCLWIFRVDNVCRNNYNLLWALPTHAVIAFFMTSRKKWVRVYWLLTALLSLVTLLMWRVIPQEFNNSIPLLVIIILFRSTVRYIKTRQHD